MIEGMAALIVLLAGASVGMFLWARTLRTRLGAETERAAASEREVVWWRAEFGSVRDKTEREAALSRSLAALEAAHWAATANYNTQMAAAESARHAAERSAAARLADLQQSVTALEEQANLQDAGLYKARYDFGTLADYEARLEHVRLREEAMVKADQAAFCTTKWHVDGNVKAGEKMVRDFTRLMLRAFNGTADSAVAKVTYKNFATLERRVRADFAAINKLGESKSCLITDAFLALKLEELTLVFEYQERKQRVAEEQRAEREQMREQEKADRELERAKEEVEKEELRFQAALAKAQAEVAGTVGRQREALEAKIAQLQEKLAQTTAKQKAISQAQLTSAGHVYIISNLGSFGEEVYKIGMTRRLDPQDRVDELGDASVPFPFDVHAMVYTENAPELERTLHQRFHTRRVNRVNERKEFFRVTLEEIERAVREIAAGLPRHNQRELTFRYTAAADDYRRTLAMNQAAAAVAVPSAVAAPPPPPPAAMMRN